MSDSSERNRIGRANRLLHWYEILTLKSLGFRLYDLGGIPLDSSDAAKNSIAQFKLEFGGTPLVEYSGLVPTNLIGRALLPLARRRL
jgi:lipid II:glycine glycyltransferase (peptidoglycan interpeptide bridge formation enzyme)